MSVDRSSSRMGWIAVAGAFVAIVALVAISAVAARGMQEAPFPHADHQGLFPLCTGCHEGIPTGDETDFYPEPATCTGCHDGVREVEITWTGPSERVGNVVYDHAEHATDLAEAGDPAQDCASCHVAEGGERMAVEDQVQLGNCWSCHAHEAEVHEVDADCAACHVPLARTAFGVSRIESLTVPADHESAAFLDELHGELAANDAARCATCHTQQRCTACHVDTERAAIAAVPPAPDEMELPPRVAHYNEPESHVADDWLEAHGGLASRQECATCHTSNDCTSCHVQPVPAAIAEMPAREDVVAPGVRTAGRAPASHDGFFFMEAHGPLAAASPANCATCHQERICVSCHDGPPSRGGYHEADFLAQHAANAFGRQTECASCHDTERFCRSCHSDVGLTAAGRLGPGYHDGGPAWLLRHGQAARQGLESCASCHRQVDCTQCHGVLGAFKVSPHTLGFDAERAWARSPRTCLGCHVGNPLTGR